MEISKATFIKSSSKLEECPSGNLPEYAFVGRSNVGKSSLINMLTNRKKLAKISSTPGKTQTINHFLIDDDWHLVDLPGYGWAKVGLKMKQQWEEHINNYLIKRANLICLFVLIDIRLAPQKNDLHFMEWLVENEIPFAIIFTKADKLTLNKTNQHVASYFKTLKRLWSSLPPHIITSAVSKRGQGDLLNYIHELNLGYRNNSGF